jgi:hypothetical protein
MDDLQITSDMVDDVVDAWEVLENVDLSQLVADYEQMQKSIRQNHDDIDFLSKSLQQFINIDYAEQITSIDSRVSNNSDNISTNTKDIADLKETIKVVADPAVIADLISKVNTAYNAINPILESVKENETRSKNNETRSIENETRSFENQSEIIRIEGKFDNITTRIENKFDNITNNLAIADQKIHERITEENQALSERISKNAKDLADLNLSPEIVANLKKDIAELPGIKESLWAQDSTVKFLSSTVEDFKNITLPQYNTRITGLETTTERLNT